MQNVVGVDAEHARIVAEREVGHLNVGVVVFKDDVAVEHHHRIEDADAEVARDREAWIRQAIDAARSHRIDRVVAVGLDGGCPPLFAAQLYRR